MFILQAKFFAMKEKIQLEYVINSSPKVLFDHVSTPSGLSKWFADDVNVNGDVFTFIWEGEEEKAKVIGKKIGNYIKFKWEDDDDKKSYFEFKIIKDDLTGDIVLIITDFVDEEEKEETIELWDSQIEDLMQVLGV